MPGSAVVGNTARMRALGLGGLVSPDREASVERWVQVTAEALEAPVALATLVDSGRQFVRAIVGLDGLAIAEHRAPMADALCERVVTEAVPVVHGDVHEVAHGADLVAAGFSAFAGMPLRVGGTPAGTLCVLDRRRRAWTPAQVRLLQKLSDGLSSEIELRLAGAELTRTARLTEAHNRIHELIAADEPLPSILGAIITSIETHDPALMGSIMLLDPTTATLHHGSPSRLPADYLAGVDGIAVGPQIGSCGAAAYSGQEVIGHDLHTDPRWAAFQDLIRPHGLRHCWSFPITGRAGTVLGSFGVYGPQPRSPSEEDRRFMRDAAKLAGIAIERRQTSDRLIHDATHDSLTGLSNRASAFAHLQDVLARQADHPTPVSVLFIDLDRLKRVNDSLGHDVGDQVIREAAQRLDRCAGPEFVARIGGEEFLIVAVGGHDRAAQLGDAVLEALQAPVTARRHVEDLTITGSVGVAVISGPGVDAQEAMRRADLAMYAAKVRGGNTYAWADDDGERGAAGRRLQVETALRSAVERGELSVVFQPIIGFEDEGVVAVEALARWTHPDLGAVPPDEFVPIAEQTGLIHGIGAFVLAAACAALPALAERHGPGLQLAVNVSAQQLHDPGLPRRVAEILTAHGISPDRLALEVTETALLSVDAGTATTVEGLDAMGVRIVLDDFGTGYSSPTLLKRHPIAAIKLDRSFVDGIPDERDDVAIVTALVGMAKGLGLLIVAEGIETPEQFAVLRDLGCDRAQGYLVGRPGALTDPPDVTAA
ncbi:EAL domain-containing protein [Paraconexibacter antarcticus]|uniref:EAL domain-containing protein n=1 Tax=Paraconexibacter antarcticus TaxID=2949664 RepID=A0ABY5DQJ8_9ACTN|nr:EAL domain-containing protein [Paraconexibacter antarcticus]UTI62985.1 EAL domain-containing protein [Paraconexibacter antarcticus]